MTNEILNMLVSNEPVAKPFGAMLAWRVVNGGVAVIDDATGVEYCRVRTPYPSRDGLRMIEAIRAAGDGCKVQVSDHGCGRKSIQTFRVDGTLCRDVDLGT